MYINEKSRINFSLCNTWLIFFFIKHLYYKHYIHLNIDFDNYLWIKKKHDAYLHQNIFLIEIESKLK